MSEKIPPVAPQSAPQSAPQIAPQIAPLAKTLFGWALNQKRFAPAATALGIVGLLLIAEELVRGRPSLNLPYENIPAFYGVFGVLVVAAALLIAHVITLVFARLHSDDDA